NYVASRWYCLRSFDEIPSLGFQAMNRPSVTSVWPRGSGTAPHGGNLMRWLKGADQNALAEPAFANAPSWPGEATKLCIAPMCRPSTSFLRQRSKYVDHRDIG